MATAAGGEETTCGGLFQPVLASRLNSRSRLSIAAGSGGLPNPRRPEATSNDRGHDLREQLAPTRAIRASAQARDRGQPVARSESHALDLRHAFDPNRLPGRDAL